LCIPYDKPVGGTIFRILPK